MNTNAQKQTNETARKVKAKINVFHGWKITDKDDNEYYVSKIADVYAILAELEKQTHGEQN